MPREFEDLSKSVASGAAAVKERMGEMAEAADKADKSTGNLSDTQKGAVGIMKKFAGANSHLTNTLKGVHSQLGKTGGSLSAYTKEIGVNGGEVNKHKKITDQSAKANAKLKKSHKDIEGQIKSLNPLVALLSKSWGKGSDEAKGYAAGVGETSGAFVGAGVAAVYLTDKLGKLAGEWVAGAKGLNTFKIEAAALGGTIHGVTGPALESMRNELTLTREQAKEFFSVVSDASAELGMSSANILSVSKSLQESFGGDQTARLKEYVDLLKSIPTLETDMKITASLDDQSAAIFGLAQTGKMEAFLDLQQAGLLGGTSTADTTVEERKLLRASQKTEKTVEDVHDLMRDYFPASGAALSAIAEHTLKGFGAVGGLIAITGAMRIFMGRKQDKTTKAVDRVNKTLRVTAGKGRGAGGGRGRGRDAVALRKTLMKFVPKKTATGITRSMATGVGSKMLSVGKLASGVGAAALAVEFGLNSLGSHLTKMGDELGAETAGIAADFAGALGVIGGLAILGSAFGPVGTALGALSGVMVAAVFKGKDLASGFEAVANVLQKEVDIRGQMVKMYSVETRSFGDDLKNASGGVGTFGLTMKNMAKMVYDGNKYTNLHVAAIDQSIKAYKRFSQNMLSNEYKIALADAGVALDGMGSSTSHLALITDLVNKRLEGFQKGVGDSGRSLSKSIKMMDNEFNSSAFKILDFKKDLSALSLSNLADFGDSLGSFSAVASRSSDAINSKFDKMNKTILRTRKQIGEMGMSGEDASNAFAIARKQELEATREYINGVQALTAALINTPKMIESELRQKIAQTDLGGRMAVGAATSSEISGTANKSLEEIASRIDELRKGEEQSRKEFEKASSLLDGIQRTGVLSSESAAEVKEETGVDVNDLENAASNLQKLGEVYKKQKSQMDEFRESLLMDDPIVQANALADAMADVNAAQMALKKTTDPVKKREMINEITTLENAVDDAASSFSKTLRKSGADMGKGPSGDVAKALAVKMSGGSSKDLLPLIQNAELASAAADSVSDFMKKSSPFWDEYIVRAKQAGTVKTGISGLKIATGAQGVESEAMKAQLAASEKRAAMYQEMKAINESIVNVMNGDVATGLGRLVADLDMQAAMHSAVGDGIEAASVAAYSNIARLSEQDKALKKATKEQQAKISEAKVKVSNTTGDEKEDALVEQKAAEDGLAAIRKARTGVLKEFGSLGDSMEAALSRIESTFSGRGIKFTGELSDAMFELTDFSSDVRRDASKARKLAIKAAKEKHHIEEMAIEESIALERAAAISKIEAIGGSDSEKAKSMEEAEAGIQMGVKAKMAKAEAEFKKSVMEAGNKEAAAKTRLVGLAEDRLSAEQDFLSYTGANFSVMLDNQTKMVGLAKKQYQIEVDRLNEMSTHTNSGAVLAEQRNKVDKAWMEMQKRSMGIQKDTMEKLLGAAFGAIRGSVGARKGRTTTAQMLGTDRSRVFNASGMVMDGQSQTIDERRARRETGFFGGGGATKLGAEGRMGAGRGGAGGPAGGASGSAPYKSVSEQINSGLGTPESSSTMMIKGELMVHFDTPLFKSSLATILASVIASEDSSILTALDKVGVVRSR